MDNEATTPRARGDPKVHVKIGNREQCWKTLAALIEKRASAIYQRRAETTDEGTELWKLAESQVVKPLCCGILKLTSGWLISFSAAELGTTEIEMCAEPQRLILLGRNPSIGGTGVTEPVVRVLKLPDAVDPSSLKFRQEGPLLDIELRAAVTDNQPVPAGKAA